MTTFLICRHGQTENNKRDRFSGWIDTPLTEQGVHDAQSSAEKLKGTKLSRIVSSDLGRAFTTAYIITRQLGLSIEIERMSGLREANYGDFANLPYSVYPELSPEENAVFVSPNGESLTQMQERVLACVYDLAAQSPEASILLAAHDGTINAIRASYLKQHMGIADLVHNAHNFVGTFTIENGVITSFAEV